MGKLAHLDPSQQEFSSESDATARFFAALFDDGEDICVRAFKPKGAPDTPNNRPQKMRFKMAHVHSRHPEVARLNETRGIYVVVNSGGDDDDAITRYNAFFVENDELPIDQQHALLDAAPLQPNIRVETGKSVHAYWLSRGGDLEAWRHVQERLIAFFGGDPRNKNPSRLMRLPGFDHLHFDKATGATTRKPVMITVMDTARRYTLEEVQAAFPPPASADAEPKPDAGATYGGWEALNAALGQRVASHPTAKRNREGIYHCKGVCHNGTGDTAVMYAPSTGAVKCMKGCAHEQVLRAFGLPARPEDARETKSEKSGGGRESQAAIIVRLADSAQLFHTGDHTPYASIVVGGHTETWPVRSRGFRDWLHHRFYEEEGKPPSSQAVNDALNTIAGLARYRGESHEVHTRVAEHDGDIYIHLADEEWRVVQITRDGWRVIPAADAPVRFKRTDGTLSLPAPQPGGSLDSLRQFVNLSDEDGWVLLSSWLVATLRPGRPVPILTLHGEQGSAKTTSARVLTSMIDPQKAALRSEPRDTRDLAIAAGNRWLLGYDNLSHIPAWLSDSFCRLTTGAGFATRALYMNDEEVIFEAQRPILLTSIEDIATRSDLLDRAVVLYLPPIPERERRPEADFWASFEKAKPTLTGSLYDAVASALARVDGVKLGVLPRMADFAVWATAAAEALGFEAGAFVRAFTGNRATAHEMALEASPVAALVRQFMAARAEWSGTATELLRELDSLADENTRRERNYPKHANRLSNVLRSLAPDLRATGINHRDARTGKARTRLHILEKLTDTSSAPSASSAPLLKQQLTTYDREARRSMADDISEAAPSAFNYEEADDFAAMLAEADGADGATSDFSHFKEVDDSLVEPEWFAEAPDGTHW